MKTLSNSSKIELQSGVKALFTLILKKDTKKINAKKEALIKKFDKENVESAFNAYVAEQSAKQLNAQLALNASNNVPDALSNADGISDAEIQHDMLKALSALGVKTEILSSGGKSIFKKEFNNKTDRTKCRNAFQSSLQRYLVHTAHNKKDLADKELLVLKGIADKYYLAESAFKNVSDYCTDNMQADKRSLIKMFIDIQNPIVAA